jgi:hypothetical protein
MIGRILDLEVTECIVEEEYRSTRLRSRLIGGENCEINHWPIVWHPVSCIIKYYDRFKT